jgi:site-specific recombinase XerD
MKQYQTVEELMDSCIQYFEQQSYSPLRIDRYKFLWKSKLIPFMVQKSFLYYDPSVGEEYIRSKIAGSIVTPYERDIIRSVNVLNEFQEKGTISKTHCKPIKRELSGQIGRLMNKFLLHLESLRRSRITISDHRLYLSRFLFYLDSKQVNAIEEVKEEYILSFVSTQTNNQIGIVSTIRFFFRFLYEERIIQSDLSAVLQHYKWVKKEKLPSVYNRNEVFQIESSIHRENATGKRNYAMTLLASRLGLRASDIAHLTFGNIDWENSTITLSQFKTGKKIELPLLVEIGEAIIDYLKYGCKKSESPRIFLYTRAPFTAMTNAAVAGTLGRTVDASGVDTAGRKHGAHAMRHSLASRFLENQESMPVISDALGHQSTNTTMSYLRIDVESLRKCALYVPLVEPSFYEQEGGAFYE